MSVHATALVGIGSNVGDSLASLRDAVARLRDGAIAETTVIACSGVYESRAVGAGGSASGDANFSNAVIVLDTRAQPRVLLAGLHEIERVMGRVRRERWGPRVIDLDLLAWIRAGEVESVPTSGNIELPHPRMAARDFVLAPLIEVWPLLVIDGRPIAEHLAGLRGEARAVVGRLDVVL